jgi:hypothetical protein
MLALTNVRPSLQANVAPVIINAEAMTPAMARYWNQLAARLTGRVDIVDPWRHSLRDLRTQYCSGVRVYRASTGGRWGKSSETVTL